MEIDYDKLAATIPRQRQRSASASPAVYETKKVMTSASASPTVYETKKVMTSTNVCWGGKLFYS